MNLGTIGRQPSTNRPTNTRRTSSLHPLEEIERNKQRRMSMSVSPSANQSYKNNATNNLNQRAPQQSTIDNKNEIKIRLQPSSFEGYSSVTSIDSRYLNSHTNEKWKHLIAFMYSESSIMFYSNVFLMVS